MSRADSSASLSRRNVSRASSVGSVSMRDRQMMHPLEREDPLAFKFIEFVSLEYLEKEAPIPIPRNQELPEDAFGTLTGRSILVSLSHGWFFQMHPDPNGEKLKIIREVFAPRLRERYPHMSIVVFFDFLATPQRPRTDDEDERFRIAMERMNSVYVVFEREARESQSTLEYKFNCDENSNTNARTQIRLRGRDSVSRSRFARVEHDISFR